MKKLVWRVYAGGTAAFNSNHRSYVSRTERGSYYVNPPTFKNRRWNLMFANDQGYAENRLGLWSDLGYFQTPNQAKAAAEKDFHSLVRSSYHEKHFQHEKNPVKIVDERAVNELFLFTVNDPELYERHTIPIMKNLIKFSVKGTYRPEKALQAWRLLADIAARKYEFDFGKATPNARNWRQQQHSIIFDVDVRNIVAQMLSDHYAEEFAEMKKNPITGRASINTRVVVQVRNDKARNWQTRAFFPKTIKGVENAKAYARTLRHVEPHSIIRVFQGD